MNRFAPAVGRIILMILACFLMMPSADCANPTATQVAEGMVDSMAKGDFASATKDFDAVMTSAMPAEKLEQTWSQLTAQYGAFKSRTGSREALEAGFQTVHVTCQFEKAALDVKVVFNSSGRVSGLWITPAQPVETPYRVPPYVKTEMFEESPCFVNKGGQWQLPGMLTFPKGKGPFPAVVLVHGSGPQDRDETIGPNRFFKDIAWGLASNGIAVLRYDKRSKVHGPKMAEMDKAGKMNRFTVRDETIDDALAAVAALRVNAKIDPKKIFVLGHSLGGLLAPRIGKADPRIAGLIIAAGCTTESFEDTLRRQFTYIASLSGPVTDEARKEIEKAVDSTVKAVPASYMADLNAYMPTAAAMAKSLPMPMLIMQGERDYQATTADFKAWKNTLSARADITFKLYPDLNHLFMTGTGMAMPSEYEKPGSVAAVVITDVASWIVAQ